jgi:hypothetical protein
MSRCGQQTVEAYQLSHENVLKCPVDACHLIARPGSLVDDGLNIVQISRPWAFTDPDHMSIWMSIEMRRGDGEIRIIR